jgi:3-hydroxybutyryl-CoA dehydrogenase
MTDINRAVVLGAGTMGHGIAQVCAMSGIETELVDIDLAVLDAGREKIKANLDKGVAKGKVTAEARDEALGRMHFTCDLETAASKADLFVEAIPERMELKREVFGIVDKELPDGALLASNTSSLSITEIASATRRPESVVGLHFFNPVHIMKLLEIVRGAATSDATIERSRALAERLGKTCVVVNDAPGFATSRLGITLGNEAMRMVEEGVASPADIDTAMKLGYGHPMGPLALSDLVGLDVRLNITLALHEEIGTDGFKPPRILRRLVRAGCHGKKNGKGFYIWEDGKPVKPNPLAWRS